MYVIASGLARYVLPPQQSSALNCIAGSPLSLDGSLSLVPPRPLPAVSHLEQWRSSATGRLLPLDRPAAARLASIAARVDAGPMGEWCVFSFIRCSQCGSSAFLPIRGLVVVLGWTNLRLDVGEPTGVCRACRIDGPATVATRPWPDRVAGRDAPGSVEQRPPPRGRRGGQSSRAWF